MTLDVGEAKHWTYRTKRCKLVKNDVGHWCGYTQTALRGFTSEDVYDFGGHESIHVLSAHGGITYGPDEDGWVGFDCGHARDLCLNEHGEPWGTTVETLGNEHMEIRRHGSVEACEEADDCFVWRLADVKREVEQFADQLIALEAFMEAVDRE